MNRTIKQVVLDNNVFYIVIGVALAIITARTYVLLGGNLNFSIGTIIVHHFFIGVALVVFTGILSFIYYDNLSGTSTARRVLATVFGFGTGLIIDEANFLVSNGQTYTLAQYYSNANTYTEIAAVTVIFLAFLINLVMLRRTAARTR